VSVVVTVFTSGTSGDLRERGGQCGPGLVEPGLDGTHRDVKVSCDLAVAQALQVEQQHGLALAVGQGGDGAVHARGGFGGLGRLRRAGELRRLVGQAGHLRPELAQPSARHVERDSAEPGAEPVRGTQAFQVGHRGDRRFLGGVTRQFGGAQDPRGQEYRGVPVTAQQLGERLPVSRERLVHQVGV
jgi:hypothetical protein